MRVEVDISKVVPAALMKGDDAEETAELEKMLEEASAYLKSFSWVRDIKAAYLGIGVPKVLGVFLFEIVSSRKDVDDKLWVIVGDLPSAYITAEESPKPLPLWGFGGGDRNRTDE